MLKSMTAFGRGQAPARDGAWVVELRCVNSRFMDPHFRLPPGLAGLEDRIKKLDLSQEVEGEIGLVAFPPVPPDAEHVDIEGILDGGQPATADAKS